MQASQYTDKAHLEKLMSLFDATHIGLWEMDAHNDITFLNPDFYRQFGFSEAKVPFSRWLDQVHPEDRERLKLSVVAHQTAQYESFRTEYRALDVKGGLIWLDAIGLASFDDQGAMVGMIGAHIDVTLQKTYEVISTIQRHVDALLKRGIRQIEQILQGRLMIFRIAANEFALLASNRLSLESVSYEIKALQRALVALYQDFRIESEVRIASSVLQFPMSAEETSGEDLLYYGLLALHEANRQKQYTPLAFSKEMPKKLLKSIHIDSNLMSSLAKGEIINRYQPIYNRITGKIEGFEALVRWQSEVWGEIYPDEFIGVCEQNRMIIELGRHVLRDALDFVNTLGSGRDLGGPTVSVNISVIQLLEADFVEMVLKMLDLMDVAPQRLKLEITESITMETYPEVRERLGKLLEKGVGISLDDFGTGYSSLNNLILTPINQLKIDRSIMVQALKNTMIEQFIKAVVDLCHAYNINIVGEGIEDKAMIDLAMRMDIDALQGYYYSKPLMPDAARRVYLEAL